jgi:hypothetical protein
MTTLDITAIIEAVRAGTEPAHDGAFAPAKTVGGTAASSFLAHPANKGAGIRVLGYDPDLDTPQDLGIEIAIADDNASIASTGMLEQAAIDAINLLPGYRATRHGEGLAIETDTATVFDPDDVATVIHTWLTRTYGVRQLAVRLIFGPPGGRSAILRDLRGQAYTLHRQRNQ